ncbi:MAG: sulfotransferase [Nocardioidaceae bacterium]
MSAKVVYIGGYGRSGSTLLDHLLGQIDGFCSVGEVRHVLPEGVAENRRCGCGQRFAECPFWRAVMGYAFPPQRPDAMPGAMLAKGMIDKWWRVPQIATGQMSADRRARMQEYLDSLDRLYDGIELASGADLIVDSSKDPSHGWLLSRLERPVYVVHLIRDPRAVAYSWHRHRHNPGSGAPMARYNPLKASLAWDASNLLVAGLRGRLPYLPVQYEELVRRPAVTVQRIADFVGSSADTPFAPDGRTVTLRGNHAVAGNPLRFERGPITVREDDEWRTKMPTARKVLVSSLTLPGLVAARYVPS